VAGGLVFLVSLVPYLLAQANAPVGRTFNGFFFLADDASTYIAKMREGADGAWGWRDPYISTPQASPVLLFLFYILWGKVAALLHVSMYVGYHLARLSGAIALVAGARLLAAECLPPGRPRRVGVILAIGGSGLGWILQLAAGVSGIHHIAGQQLDALELHLPELSGFYSIMAIPHFAWAAALMAFGLVGLVRLAEPVPGRVPWRPLALAAGALVAMCLIHPQMLFVLAPLAFAHLLMRRPPRRAYLLTAVPFILCSPLLVYFLQVLTGDSVVVAWAREWRHQAPDPLGFVFGLGLPLVLAGVAAVGWGTASPLLRLLMVWVAMVFLMLYLPNPVNIQRRLIDGIYLPVAILAAAGLEEVIARRGRRPGGFLRAAGPLTVLAVGLSVLMSTLVFAAGMIAAAGREPIIYLDRGEVAAIDWLSSSRLPGLAPAVLSHPQTGLFIPARSGDRVYVGHYSETIDYLHKGKVALQAYGDGPAEVIALARDVGADYVFYGPLELALSPAGARPAVAAGATGGVEEVYGRDGVFIYRLR